jgi:hypothetical protein
LLKNNVAEQQEELFYGAIVKGSGDAVTSLCRNASRDLSLGKCFPPIASSSLLLADQLHSVFISLISGPRLLHLLSSSIPFSIFRPFVLKAFLLSGRSRWAWQFSP